MKSRLMVIAIIFALIIVNGAMEATHCFAGVPQLINYQGKLTDDLDQPLTGTYSITFKLWDHETSTDPSNLKWTEEHSSVTVTDGLYNVLLGEVETDTLGEEFETYDTLYMEITVDTVPPSTPETLSPRMRVGSAGYAIKAEGVTDGAITTKSLANDAVEAKKINVPGLDGDDGKVASISSANFSSLEGTYLTKLNGSNIASGTVSADRIADAFLKNNGDTATGNYNFDSGTLYVDATTDFVGIGTTGPSDYKEGEKLGVMGNILLSSGASRTISVGKAGWNEAGYDLFIIGGKGGLTAIPGGMPGGDVYIDGGPVYPYGDVLLATSFGNVGIGTAGPQQKLQLVGGSFIGIPPSESLGPYVPTGWQRGSSGIILAGSETSDGSSGWRYGGRVVEVDHEDGFNIEFDVNDGGTWTNNALVISGRNGRQGNVGIGTTKPSAELEVKGDIALSSGADRTIYVKGSAGVAGSLTMTAGDQITDAHGGSLYLHGGSGGAGGDVFIYGGSGGFDGDVILAHTGSTGQGNVGIGTTSPNLASWSTALTISNAGTAPNAIGIELQGSRTNNGLLGAVGFYNSSTQVASMSVERESMDAAGTIRFYTRDTSFAWGERMRIKADGNVGIGTTDPGSYKLNVAGTVKADAYKTTVYTAGGVGSGAASLSNANTWGDFPDLSITFSLSEPTTISAFYQVAMLGGSKYLCTRTVVDGGVVSRTITGDTVYWGNSDFWVGELATGSHTIKVQYRTSAGGTNNPAGSDWQNRVLRVMVFGS